ncbi:uncharacterized protein N7482_005461 [Penicillium canariense]|uniref:Uncharacterized protein n=1 Tax=Penicillium canariense TaxID=189055 RepID=A0A9W9I2F8_9EURO|nr:uncharacterized protein N7482_005461 [Penicillium canariense]KAJ5166680.1 hypothetical protein N7482_005461 [Penicillium canariense]
MAKCVFKHFHNFDFVEQLGTLQCSATICVFYAQVYPFTNQKANNFNISKLRRLAIERSTFTEKELQNFDDFRFPFERVKKKLALMDMASAAQQEFNV